MFRFTEPPVEILEQIFIHCLARNIVKVELLRCVAVVSHDPGLTSDLYVVWCRSSVQTNLFSAGSAEIHCAPYRDRLHVESCLKSTNVNGPVRGGS